MARTVGGIVPLDGPWIPERLKQAAEVIAEDARVLSATWSERVPASVRVGRVRGTGPGQSVTITAGGVPAPTAPTKEGHPRGPPVWPPRFAPGGRAPPAGGPPPPPPPMPPRPQAHAPAPASL